MSLLVSLVVPVLSDGAAAAQLLSGISSDPRLEILLVDGGFDEDLARLAASRADTRLVRTRPGRGLQMNAGAAASRADWLIFVHADSQLPSGWLDVFEARTAGAAGGWFRFALDDSAWQARVLERGTALRVRLFRLPYGDQGLFVRREVFRDLGGYRELPLMEDVDFVRRLVNAGPVVELPLPLTTSARRWRRDGWFRCSARNLILVSLYFAGISSARLARWY
jgi:rSAM/selenodomain-associated transferase 2